MKNDGKIYLWAKRTVLLFYLKHNKEHFKSVRTVNAFNFQFKLKVLIRVLCKNVNKRNLFKNIKQKNLKVI